jgi:FKBP-type peptidyl-prolyl cis-trans isomerase
MSLDRREKRRMLPICAALLAISQVAAAPADPTTSPVSVFSDPDAAAARAAANRQLAAGAGAARAFPSLRYRVLRSGPADGRQPTRHAYVKLRYEGSLLDGTVFATTRGGRDDAQIFRLGGTIAGFMTTVQAMRPGDIWQVYVPVEFAYPQGDRAVAGKALVFRIELVDFREMPPPAPPPMLDELPSAPSS